MPGDHPGNGSGTGSGTRALALALAGAAALLIFTPFPPSASATSGSARATASNASARKAALASEPRDPHALLSADEAQDELDEERGLAPEERTRFMGEMQGAVEILQQRVARPGTAGEVAEAVRRMRAFCRHAYRVLGKHPDDVSREDARTALADADLLRTRAVNALAGLHLAVGREKRRRDLARAEEAFASSSEAHVAELRRGLLAAPLSCAALREPYGPGRGFPAPWWGPAAEGHADHAAGAEARFRLAAEF